MVRVLLSAVVLAQPMGGVRRHSAELLPRAARILRDRGGALAVLEGREKIPFELPEFVERIPSSVPAHPVIARATLEGRALRRALEAAAGTGARFDLVHTGHLPVPRHLKTPHCVTIHDLRALELEHTPLSRRLIARKVIGAAVEGAALVITVSQHVREQLLARFRLHPDRVRVVPNAADHFTALPRQVGANAAILHVGHVERRKNLEVVVRALALDPTLPRLCLAGDAKLGEDESLRELARELGVQERVEFLGPFADERLADLLATAACMVLPSRLEGFGIPALEACRARLPLAISRTPALLEVAGDETPSFAPDDPAECASAIRAALASSPSTLQAAAVAAERFSWDNSARLLVEAWRAAVGEIGPS